MKEKLIIQKKAEIAAIFKKKKGKKSYYEIAKTSGLTIQQLHSIEQSKSYTIDSLVKLCSSLGCELSIK